MKRRLYKADLERDVVPVIDALVSFVPEGETPTPVLQSQLDQRGLSRWFPVAGGHLVKMPFDGDEPPPGPFQIEPGGWDHEHCDTCEANLRVGEALWKTRDANFVVICDACYEQLPARRKWWHRQ